MAIKKEPGKPQTREQIIAQRLKARGHDVDNVQMGEKFDMYEFIPMGIKELDAALTGKDGVSIGSPTGTILEISGPSQSGKTYIAYCHVAEHQKLNRRAAYCDVENTFYEPRAVEIGVQVHNPELFELYRNMGTGEEWTNWILDMIKTGDYGIIIIDSVKVMMPSAEFQKEMGAPRQSMAHATMMRDFLTRAMPYVSRYKTTLVLINHEVTKSGGMPNTFVKGSAGGSSIEYLTHQRIHVSKINGKAGHLIGTVNGQTQRIGGRSRAIIHKTRFGIPEQLIEFPIPFGKYQNNPLAEFVYRAMAHKEEYIQRRGTKPNYVYRFVDTNTGEVLAEGSNDVEIIEALMTAPPPSKMPKGVKAETAFEFIANRLKVTPDQIEAINGKLQAILTGEFTPSEMEEENPYDEIDQTSDEGDEGE
jgi:RecA/RadA recombinase